MSATLARVQALVSRGDLRISEHGYDELAADDIFAADAIEGLEAAIVVEDYPEFPKGPCVLVFQRDSLGRAIHVLWGIAKGRSGPAVLITAYRPDPARWSNDFQRRRTQSP